MRRIRLFGHPLHPPLTHFPLGLLCTVPVWDAVALVRDEPAWWTVAHWTLALGLVLALPAAVTGLVDYAALPPKSEAEGTARAHLVAVLAAVGASGASFLLRVRGDAGAPEPAGWTVGLALGGAVVLGVAGWLGAELTFGHGVGVRVAGSGDGRRPEDRPESEVPDSAREILG